MFEYYIKIAARTLLKHRGYTFINLFGLTAGMACFILIGLFVRFELNYDTYHDKANRIYRVAREDPERFYLGSNHFAGTPAPLADALKTDFAEVIEATRIKTIDGLIANERLQNYESGLLADEHLFQVFTFPMMQGDATTALAEPNSIVLTRSMAEKYFAHSDAIGKTLKLQNQIPLRVTGIIKDIPDNSHFTFDYIVSFKTDPNYLRNLERWEGDNSYYTYFVLREGLEQNQFEEKLPAFTQKHLAGIFPNADQMPRFYLQSLTDIHLLSHLNFELGKNGDIRSIYMLSAIAFLILLLACINYTNLSTARSTTRTNEVGMRRVAGANRPQLIKQFLTESITLALIAVFIAAGLVETLLPIFNQLVERQLSLAFPQNVSVFIVLIGLGLLVGILSGSYPALILSSLKPLQMFKHGIGRKSSRAHLRTVLVVGQFAATIVLIMASVVIQQQLHFILSKDIGLNKEQVVVIPVNDREAMKQYRTIKNELLRNPNVVGVSSASHVPTQISNHTVVTDWEGNTTGQSLPIYTAAVNYDFVEMFEIEMVEGRSFSEAFGTDSEGAILLNEAAYKQLGWQSTAGKAFNLRSSGGANKHVVGVMKDFHFQSFHQTIAPLALYLDPERVNNLLVKIRGQHTAATVSFLEKRMRIISPNYPFTYFFLDDAFNRMYQREQKLGQILGYFTAIALVIACLGLLGIASFTAAQRTKEIGIRKVLGATVANVITLLSTDFVKLVLVANLIAWPVAWYAMNKWLQNFAYRIEISWWVFALTGGMALVIALLTVSTQAIRAALANPVEALRYE